MGLTPGFELKTEGFCWVPACPLPSDRRYIRIHISLDGREQSVGWCETHYNGCGCLHVRIKRELDTVRVRMPGEAG